MTTAVRKIPEIQVMRGIAATMVLLYHLMFVEQKYTGFDLMSAWAKYGHYGVDVFFVISGFIMAVTTRHISSGAYTSAQFLMRRSLRIYPLYWIFTTLVLCVYLVRPDMVNSSASVEADVLRSYLLLPQAGQPLLGVGWTLVYEMYFYLAFAVLLLLPRHILPYGLFGWALFTVLLGTHGMNYTPFLKMAASPMCLEFIGGAAIGLAWRGWESGRRYGFLSRLGDASYAIYLSHVLTISLSGRIWVMVGNDSAIIHVIWLCASLYAALGCGWFAHRYIEHPIQTFCYNGWRTAFQTS